MTDGHDLRSNPLLGARSPTPDINTLQQAEHKQPPPDAEEFKRLKTEVQRLTTEVDSLRYIGMLEDQLEAQKKDEGLEGKRALNPLLLPQYRSECPDPRKIPPVIKYPIARQFDDADEGKVRASSKRYRESLERFRTVSAATSQLTGASSKEESVAYHTNALDIYYDVLKTDWERHETALGALKKTYHAGSLSITEVEYQGELAMVLESIQRIKWKMITCRTNHAGIVGTMVDAQRWVEEKEAVDWAYIDGLIRFYTLHGYQHVVAQAKRDVKTQQDYRKRVIAAYDAKKTEDNGDVCYWCPVVGEHKFPPPIGAQAATAAHIVPDNLSELAAEYIFGGKSTSMYGHLWDVENSLFMSDMYEKAFDAARLIIVPVNPDIADGRYKIVVIDTSLLKERDRERPWGARLQDRELRFRGEFRPDPLKIYFSGLVNVFRRQQHEAPGWWRGLLQFLTLPRWAARSQLPRSSTLKAIARRMGQCAAEELEFLSISGEEEPDVELDELAADTLGFSPSDIPHAGTGFSGTSVARDVEPTDERPEEDDAAESSRKSGRGGKGRKDKKKGKQETAAVRAESSVKSAGGGKKTGKQESPEAESSPQGVGKSKKCRRGNKGRGSGQKGGA